MPTPTDPISPQWAGDLESFARHQRRLGRVERTIEIRYSAISLLARWLADRANGLMITEPKQVTKVRMEKYLDAQIRQRQRSGYLSLWADLHVWWKWWHLRWAQRCPWKDSPARP